jgi:hypothetical protein
MTTAVLRVHATQRAGTFSENSVDRDPGRVPGLVQIGELLAHSMQVARIERGCVVPD